MHVKVEEDSGEAQTPEVLESPGAPHGVRGGRRPCDQPTFFWSWCMLPRTHKKPLSCFHEEVSVMSMDPNKFSI